MTRSEDPFSREEASAAAGSEAVIAALQAENALLRSQITLLMARIAELERRLGLNSSNSGKPPSSDGLKKPIRISSLRQPSDKKTGGQKGHPGKTLHRTETPDAIIEHYPPACTTCGAALTEAMATDHVALQVKIRPTRTAAVDRHRTPWTHRLSLRYLRRADASGVSRGRRRASAVRQAHQRRGAVSAALPVAAREASVRGDG